MQFEGAIQSHHPKASRLRLWGEEADVRAWRGSHPGHVAELGYKSAVLREEFSLSEWNYDLCPAMRVTSQIHLGVALIALREGG